MRSVEKIVSQAAAWSLKMKLRLASLLSQEATRERTNGSNDIAAQSQHMLTDIGVSDEQSRSLEARRSRSERWRQI